MCEINGIMYAMRPLRNFKTNQCCHLISRIANRAFFLNDEEKTRFVERLWRVATFSCVEVLAYCFMSNHFHILVYVPDPRELSDDLEKGSDKVAYDVLKRLADGPRRPADVIRRGGETIRPLRRDERNVHLVFSFRLGRTELPRNTRSAAGGAALPVRRPRKSHEGRQNPHKGRPHPPRGDARSPTRGEGVSLQRAFHLIHLTHLIAKSPQAKCSLDLDLSVK